MTTPTGAKSRMSAPCIDDLYSRGFITEKQLNAARSNSQKEISEANEQALQDGLNKSQEHARRNSGGDSPDLTAFAARNPPTRRQIKQINQTNPHQAEKDRLLQEGGIHISHKTSSNFATILKDFLTEIIQKPAIYHPNLIQDYFQKIYDDKEKTGNDNDNLPDIGFIDALEIRKIIGKLQEKQKTDPLNLTLEIYTADEHGSCKHITIGSGSCKLPLFLTPVSVETIVPKDWDD